MVIASKFVLFWSFSESDFENDVLVCKLTSFYAIKLPKHGDLSSQCELNKKLTTLSKEEQISPRSWSSTSS